MLAKSIDPRSGGIGDMAVALWIAEGALAEGETVPFVDDERAPILRAFGHQTISHCTQDCLRLGSGHEPYEEELRSSNLDRSPRPMRWQKSVDWSFVPKRPILGKLADDATEWVRTMVAEGPFVVIAPKAGYDSRSLPLQKWLRLAWSLNANGIRTVAVDLHQHVVQEFPFYLFGFGWDHILALLSCARAVAANDSGIAHLSATIGTPTVVAMGATDPEIVFGHCLDVVMPIRTTSVPCVGCHFSSDKGFSALCDAGCDALQMLSWLDLKAAILSAYAREHPGRVLRRNERPSSVIGAWDGV